MLRYDFNNSGSHGRFVQVSGLDAPGNGFDSDSGLPLGEKLVSKIVSKTKCIQNRNFPKQIQIRRIPHSGLGGRFRETRWLLSWGKEAYQHNKFEKEP